MSQEFWDIICAFRGTQYILLGLVMTLAVLTLIALPFVQPGSPAYLMTISNLGIIIVILVPLGYINWFCKNNHDSDVYDR